MSTHIVNTHEAKSRLSELIRQAEAGAEVIVARNGQPVARIVAWTPETTQRTSGSWAGQVVYGDDVVSTDPDITQMFDKSSHTTAS